MNLDRKSWTKKLQLVKNAWREFHPGERMKHRPHLGSLDFGITFFRSLTDEIEVSTDISGWITDNPEWSLRVRLAILDRRVAKLRSEVMKGFDSSDLGTFDFDVLAAALAIEGSELEPSPLIEQSFSDDEIRLVVKQFSDRLDKLWTFARGFSVDGLETLSIWAIRNRNFVGVPLGPPALAVGVICTAFVYGERELSRELLREYEMNIEKRRRSEVVNELTRAVHAALSEDVARLRSLVS